METLTKAVDLSVANELIMARKSLFEEAHLLLTSICKINARHRTQKDDELFAAEMMRYISYLIIRTPKMTTINPRDMEKTAIQMWLNAFKLQSYDIACSALMTNAVIVFTH